jgi:hypothetical protein
MVRAAVPAYAYIFRVFTACRHLPPAGICVYAYRGLHCVPGSVARRNISGIGWFQDLRGAKLPIIADRRVMARLR